MRRTMAGFMALALAGCGGGGGTSSGGGAIVATPSPTPTPAPAPVPAPTPTPTGFRFEAAADYALAGGAKAVVAIQAGRIVLERYANGGAAGQGEALNSGTKSFTCVLAAAAEDDGLLSIDERVGGTLAAWGPGGSAPQNALKQDIRAIDLLALAAGLASTGEFGPALNGTDSYRQAIDAPSRYAANSSTIYGPNHFQAFSLFFELKTGARVNADGGVTGGRDGVDYLQSRVFDAMGIRPTAWSRDTRGKPNFGGGAQMSATDWARYGQLLEQSGMWNGRQLLSAARIERCATHRSGGFQGYGLSVVLNRPVGDSYVEGRASFPGGNETIARWEAGGQFAPSAPADMFLAAGANERRLYVIPSQDLVILRIGGPEDEDRFFQLLYGRP